jgi:hypothetical protein
MRRSAPVLVNPEFTRLWLGQAVSQLGDLVSGTALMVWIGVVLFDGRPNAPAVSGGVLVLAVLASWWRAGCWAAGSASASGPRGCTGRCC